MAAWRPGARRAADRGVVTVEYLIVAVAASAFATLLWAIAHTHHLAFLMEQLFNMALHPPS